MSQTLNRILQLSCATCLGAAYLLLVTPRADAALVYSVSSVSLQKPFPGGSELFGLTISARAVGQDEVITTTSVGIDVDPAGTGLPAGLTIVGETERSVDNSTLVTPLAGEDARVQAFSFIGVSVNENQVVPLFDLNFEATNALDFGSYNVFLENIAVTAFDPSTTTASSESGMISVSATAVPEPGSMALLAVASIGMAGVAHRRRKAKANETLS